MATYRPISENDIEILVDMMRDFYAIDGYPIDPEVSKTLFAQFISDGNLGRSWLIEQDGHVVGYVILTFIFSFEFAGRIAFIDELYIVEKARGKGIGRQTIDFIQNEAMNLDLKLLYLEVEPHNSNAKKLYFGKGFEEHKRQLMVWRRD